jgi:hypothetical protein
VRKSLEKPRRRWKDRTKIDVDIGIVDCNAVWYIQP